MRLVYLEALLRYFARAAVGHAWQGPHQLRHSFTAAQVLCPSFIRLILRLIEFGGGNGVLGTL